MSRSTNDESGNLEVPSSRAGKSSHAADASSTGDIRATDIKIDRGVPSWSVFGKKARYADTFDT